MAEVYWGGHVEEEEVGVSFSTDRVMLRGRIEQALANAWAEHIADAGIKITNGALRNLAEAVLPLVGETPPCRSWANVDGQVLRCARNGDHAIHQDGDGKVTWGQDGGRCDWH